MSATTRVGPGCTRRGFGFTLVELLVTLVLAGLIAGVAMRTFRAQQRSIGGSVALAEMRSQLRQGIHLLAIEVRPLAPGGGDVHEWASSRLVIRSVSGSSIVCARTSDTTLSLPSPGSSAGRALTSWLVSPQPGDSLLVLDTGHGVGGADDTWRAYEIASVSTSGAAEDCAALTGIGTTGEEGDASIRLIVGGAGGSHLSRTIAAGAPVRITRRIRYELYRSGDGAWYLGASECRGRRVPPCSTIQPVSGPYRSAAPASGGSGLELAYFDVHGTRLMPAVDDPGRIRRVDVIVRAEAGGTGAAGQVPLRGFLDSTWTSIAIRNGGRR